MPGMQSFQLVLYGGWDGRCQFFPQQEKWAKRAEAIDRYTGYVRHLEEQAHTAFPTMITKVELVEHVTEDGVTLPLVVRMGDGRYARHTVGRACVCDKPPYYYD